MNSNELDESVLSPFASKLISHLTSRSWEYFESNRWGGLYSHSDGTNNCWFPLARKWPTWKWTWIWIPYGKIEKNVRVTSDRIHAEIHEVWTCVAPAAPSLCHTAVNPCLKFSWRESPWNWSCNSANLRKSTVTWMSRYYVFTIILWWSTFSSTINLCNINCVGFSDMHCSYGLPILWHSPFHAGVSY